MTRGSDDEARIGLDPSLESHFAALLDRHKEAVARTEWSYQQYLPVATEQRPLSPTAYVAVETALLTEVNLPWYTAGLSHGLAAEAWSGCYLADEVAHNYRAVDVLVPQATWNTLAAWTAADCWAWCRAVAAQVRWPVRSRA